MGLGVIRAILAGERDPEVLAEMCDSRILKAKKEQVIKSLKGHYNQAGLFALEQAVTCYDFYQAQIARCDEKLEQVLNKMSDNGSTQNKGKKHRKPIRHHKPKINNLDQYLLTVFDNKDATVLPGITDYNWMQLLAEVGVNMNKWKTEKHFTSWLGLAPKQHHSGKMKKNFKSKGQPKAGLIFKQAATSLLNSKKIALGAFGRKIRARKGPVLAIKAVARKLAELYWKLFVKGLDYVEKGIKEYEQKIILYKQKNVIKMAKEMGLVVSYKTST